MHVMRTEDLTISEIDCLQDEAKVSLPAFDLKVSLQNFMATDTVWIFALAAGGLP